MATFETTCDTVRNRVYVKVQGFPTETELEQHVKKLIGEVGKLRPGFVVISDVGESKVTTPAGARVLESLMHEYKRRGVSRIVRIVSREVLTKMQLNRITQEADIPVVHAASMAEAEKLLGG